MAGMEWNEWPQWSGMSGRNRAERVEPFNRNQWPESVEYAGKPLLWGGEALVGSWGRLGTQGRSLTLLYGDRQSAQVEILCAIKRRLQRGYRVIEWD